MKKIIVIVLTMLGLWVFIPTTQVAFADPMDPLNGVEIGEATDEVSGEAFEPNAPEGVGDSPEDTKDKPSKDKGDWEEEERNRKSVQLMDTVMMVAGVAGVILSALYMGVYLGARMFPPLFLPLYRFITRGKVMPKDIPIHIMFLRSIPVAVLGMLMATGWLRKIFAYVWEFVSRNIIN